MLKQIRRGVFETNSSSVHSISIQTKSVLNMHSKEYLDNLTESEKNRLSTFKIIPYPDTVTFAPGEFGWEFESYDGIDSKASYLITAMTYVLNYNDYCQKVEQIKKWLSEEGIQSTFPNIAEMTYDSMTDCYWKHQVNFPDYDYYIDHGDECSEFVCYAISSKNNFFNYLFGDGGILTGNDNCDEDDWEKLDFCSENDFDYKWNHKIFKKGN